ncbi:hypothetical protein OSB04_003736 [Centaurea solstitialis]|uniref:Uncharacterized protein n=1 Tax=Centaurea solstitialis TaxID=347529 RepID=A0AA38WTX4_9ASTR|nr:hypothetical protein OSB04_003736 [Centaurea solstitialis]
MKIISLNVREFGIEDKKKMELRNQTWRVSKNQKLKSGTNIKRYGFCLGRSCGKSRGLLPCPIKNLDHECLMEDTSFLAIVGKLVGMEGIVGFVNVYGPRGVKEQIELWGRQERLTGREEVQWYFFGDFNERFRWGEKIYKNKRRRIEI